MSSETVTIRPTEPPPAVIPFSSVVEGTRFRDSDRYGNINMLAASIRTHGMIQPIVLSRRTDGKYDLIAGGRRYRALASLGITELHYGVVAKPGIGSFVFRHDVSEDVRRELELEENLQRLDMSWQDNVLLIARTHELKTLQNPDRRWGQKQTAAVLGVGYSSARVSWALRLARYIRDKDSEICSAPSMKDAIAILVKRKEDAALKELQARALTAREAAKKRREDSAGTGPQSSEDARQAPSADAPAISTPEAPSAPGIAIPLSEMFIHGDSIHTVMPSLPDESFDHIVTDIPYGIDMGNLTLKSIEDVAAEHDVDQNVDMMLPFLQQSFRLVKSGGFVVFFYDLDHHEKLLGFARDVGFKVQRWPLVWIKSHNCKNQSPAQNFTKTFEVAMVLRKDAKAVLRSPQNACHFQCSGVSAQRRYNNPFAKPEELWRWIYRAIAFDGQTVLDPYAGEMSSCVAALNHGLVPYGIEINEKHYNRGIEHMKSLYRKIHGNVEFH